MSILYKQINAIAVTQNLDINKLEETECNIAVKNIQLH